MSIKEKVARNKTVLANFSYLSILQVFTILFPLLTYPYLLRVIGLELYGVIVFAQSIIIYISLVINFGFNMSSAKEVAVHKDDKEKLSRIVSTTYISKFILWVICGFGYLVVITTFDFFREYYWVYFLSYLLTFNELLLPTWFFQGIEKMKYITIVNVSSRLVFVAAIFLFVREKSDYLYVPLLNGIGAIVAGVLALYIVFKKEGVQFRLSSIYGIREDYKRSFPLFVSSISTQIYVNVNKLVVGSCLGMSEVAIYDIGEKVLHLMKLPIQMVAQATFPKISREKNIHFLNRLMFMVAGIVTVGYIIMFVCSKWIVYLFTGEYISEAVTVMRILGLSAILVAFNSFMGGNRLVPFGYSKVYMRVMMQNCIFFLVGMFVLWIGGWINMYSVAGMGVLVEIVCLITLIYTGVKLKILSNYHYY